MSRRDSEGPFTFLYDGADIIQERSQVTGEITSAYRYGVLSLIQQQRSGAESWYLLDGLGSARALLDAGQVVTDTYTYDAFGNLLSSTGSTVNPFRYVGGLGYYQETDSEMLLLGARYYDPMVGRFITPDPLRDGINWYAYVRNQAPNAVDASGYFMGGVGGRVGNAAKAGGEFVYRQLQNPWVRLAIMTTLVTSTVYVLKYKLKDPHISPLYFEPEKGGYPHHLYTGAELYLMAELANLPLPSNMALFPMFKRCSPGECCFCYLPEITMMIGTMVTADDTYQHFRQWLTNNRGYESPLHRFGGWTTRGYTEIPLHELTFPVFTVRF